MASSFCDIIECLVKEGNSEQDRYSVSKYNGLYWQMGLKSKDKKTAMLVDTRSLEDHTIKIMVNLRNKKYDHDDIPDSWKKNEDQRTEDKKNIQKAYENKIVEGVEPKITNYKNMIITYEFKLADGEFLGYSSIIKYWKSVESVFNEIGGTI